MFDPIDSQYDSPEAISHSYTIISLSFRAFEEPINNLLTMRSRSGRSTDGPCRSKYLERVPFSIQGHTMELYGPREVMIPHSRTILSWSRRCHTFNSRRSLLRNREQLVFVLSQISVPCFFSFCRPLPPQIAISGL